jgi:hypothetical protein
LGSMVPAFYSSFCMNSVLWEVLIGPAKFDGYTLTRPTGHGFVKRETKKLILVINLTVHVMCRFFSNKITTPKCETFISMAY